VLDAASGSRAAFWDFMRYEMMHFGVRLGFDEADGLSGVYAFCRRKNAMLLHAILVLFVHKVAINPLYSLSIAAIGDTG
jgi:hypothetical protein